LIAITFLNLEKILLIAFLKLPGAEDIISLINYSFVLVTSSVFLISSSFATVIVNSKGSDFVVRCSIFSSPL